VKKVALLVISSLFFYSLFRDMTPLKTLMLCGAIAVVFMVSKAPSQYIVAAKYPLICLCFALTALLVLYPEVRTRQLIRFAAVFLSFFSLGLYVATIDEKAKGLVKDILALSLLLIATGVNLVLTRSPELLLPLSITTLLFLFILSRAKLVPLVAVYLVAVLIFLYSTKVSLFAPGLELSQIERYLVLSTAFLLLLVAFVGFVRQRGSMWTIAFFGLLYASIDILASLGFSVKGLVLYQPLAALLILSPLVGIALQGEGVS
jgi:hypothetical protein